MSNANDAIRFLQTDRNIDALNFQFMRHKVYPSAYRKDIANALKSNDLKIRLKGTGSAKVGAKYDYNYDSFELDPGFNIARKLDQAYFVHECAHAHLDIQNEGKSVPLYEYEAVAYLAEALFVAKGGNPPIGNQNIRAVAHKIAAKVLKGTYQVSHQDTQDLIAAVAADPHYAKAKPKTIKLSGFKRGLIHSLLR